MIVIEFFLLIMKWICEVLKWYNLIIVTAIMKKVNSKSIIPNKHKSKPAESKRNSRITSTNSCLKITPQSTEQISSKTLPLQPTLSK